MSYPNYEPYQNPGAPDGTSGPGAPTGQEAQMGGQPAEQSQAPFQGAPPGDGATPGGGQGGDQKTTLWCVAFPPVLRRTLVPLKEN